MSMDISQYQVKGAVDGVYYIPEYITQDEEQSLLQHIYDQPPKRWTVLNNRRLQNWGGTVHPKGMLPQPLPRWLTLISSDKLAQRDKVFEKDPNHVLINEYKPGEGIMPHEDGPLYHPMVANISLQSPIVLQFFKHREQCGELEAEAAAIAVDTVRTADSGDVAGDDNTRRVLYTDGFEPLMSMLLEPRSLVLFTKEAYEQCLHGIPNSFEDVIDESVVNAGPELVGQTLKRGVRVSLTIRIVTKLMKKSLLRL
eukprot:GFYU01005724.1.p1 GENE.GFYU01005724.1~~GFYU01005724.1.p1  ORF type:complete len:254 (+),score=39.72 GFYU01005724.1:73-834(+)